jgi:hypothetical protein
VRACRTMSRQQTGHSDARPALTGFYGESEETQRYHRSARPTAAPSRCFQSPARALLRAWPRSGTAKSVERGSQRAERPTRGVHREQWRRHELPQPHCLASRLEALFYTR